MSENIKKYEAPELVTAEFVSLPIELFNRVKQALRVGFDQIMINIESRSTNDPLRGYLIDYENLIKEIEKI